jgi:hypothetical protein
LGCAVLCHAVGEVLGRQLHQHQGCGMFSEGTRSLIIAKHMMVVVAATHPTSTARDKMQVFKHSVVTTLLANAESKLCNGRLGTFFRPTIWPNGL